jgi:hypothetical protein
LAAGKDFSRVKPQVQLAAPRAATIIDCPLAGFGMLRAAPDQIAALRRNPQPTPSAPLPLTLLKHADDQTVAALAAVFQASHHHGQTETDFSEWAVVAAPSYLGRAALAATLKRLQDEGAWGISPHFIPHHSLHAISGTISQALKIHGPNFGIEASPCGIAEALTVAATLLATGDLPGLWLVLTEYEPELIPLDPNVPGPDCPASAPTCIALALALVPEAAMSAEITLRVCPQGNQGYTTLPAPWSSWMPLENVRTLTDALSHGLPGRHWRLGSNGWVELADMDQH